ncbi:AAC(3) family N-acetyltransferase [Halorussus gelatinilyticus]|uniref:AAC(3) family N-acetyltransferase n=1 Tax=Halorussus gelatinilyticus TaxID=2937524 RepID=A0A8U0IEQ3_9EURY|nr:AAC(3) family N-acetyltransferase [Halorussus gelatinilyticus]UPV99224.1 AAC(3) family N-acetyltransferase [Halorussus gelatinilyticus]
MQERIDRTDEPVTSDRIATDLADLGVEPGDTLLVHSSLSSLGWVTGGAPAVVDALMEAVSHEGTLVMPTHSTQYSDPEGWQNPPVPDDWEDTIRAERPPYRPAVTPTWNVGAIPECFRTYPDVHRSRHPTYSFAAWGADAEAIVVDHSYPNGLGEESPLAEVYDRDGTILMLGTEFDTNTSFHLAEHRADREQEVSTHETTVVGDDGDPKRITLEHLSYDADDFADVGRDFEDGCPEAVTEGTVGPADANLVSQRAAVDYGAQWFEENRE